MKKIMVMVISCLFLLIATNAQLKNATCSASGLTCSMCSNAINKALLSLDFVDKVTANIKNHNCTVALINKHLS